MNSKILCAVALVAVLGFVAWGSPLVYLGRYEIDSDTWSYNGSRVGAISGITYDPTRELYYAISEDRGDVGTPGRFYTLSVDVDATGISAVEPLAVTFLDRDSGEPGVQPYLGGDVEPVEIVFTGEDTLIVSSERDRDGFPWIRTFSLDGLFLREIRIPDRYLPATAKGVRDDLAFEAMSLTPDGETLYVANEQGLTQDYGEATVSGGTVVRLTTYDLTGTAPIVAHEAAYKTEPVFASPTSEGTATNGVSAILSIRHILSPYDLLVMERAYVSGVGYEVTVFGVSLEGATDIKMSDRLPCLCSTRTASKTLLLRISALDAVSDIGVRPDSLEGMTLGPRLPDGRPTLILASNSDYGTGRLNQFLAFAIGY